MSHFKEGDLVIINPRALYATQEVLRHRGKVGSIEWCGACLVDYHKNSHVWYATVRLRDGTMLEDLEHDDLKPADAVSALGSVDEEPDGD